MRLPHCLLCLPLFFLAACSSTPEPIIQEIQATPIIKQDFAEILGNHFRGLLYFKNSRAYFTRCATDQPLVVSDNEQLRKIYEKITDQDPVPVYVEFTGEIIFPVQTTSNADAMIRADRIDHMAVAKKSLQCARPINTFSVKAKGEEPYWRLNIDDQKLYFATKARNQVYKINNTNFQTGKVNHIESINEQDEPLDLTIEPGECYNEKDNEYWGYRAKITTIWGDFQGCGEPKWTTLEGGFTGYYLYQTPSTVLNLVLNLDNTAEYSEKTDQGTILKSGFWKNNAPDRIVIMLTKQENKIIREELIFNRHGLTLSTAQTNKDNIIKKLATPLVFKKMNIKEGIEQTVTKHINRQFTPALIDPTKKVDLEVQKAVYQYFKIHRTDPQKSKFSAVTFDLNSDGIKEAIVLLDWCSHSGCEMLVFEGTDKGYRFSSRISQINAPISIAKTQHFLWQSLITDDKGQSLQLDFDGLSYPIHTTKSKKINKQYETTGIILFSKGRPHQWFSIKP